LPASSMGSQDRRTSPPPPSPSKLLRQKGFVTQEEFEAYANWLNDQLAEQEAAETDEEREERERQDARSRREAPAVAARIHEIAALTLDRSLSHDEFMAQRQAIIAKPSVSTLPRAPKRCGSRRRGAGRPAARSASRGGDSGDDGSGSSDDPDLPPLARARLRAGSCRSRAPPPPPRLKAAARSHAAKCPGPTTNGGRAWPPPMEVPTVSTAHTTQTIVPDQTVGNHQNNGYEPSAALRIWATRRALSRCPSCSPCSRR
jgi:hypothetical protein